MGADAAWPLGTVGRPAQDNRRLVNGVLWVVRSGMRWADLPERYGKYKSARKRFLRWAERGVWDRLFDDLVADRNNPYLVLDATLVLAHQQAATGRKKRAKTRLWGVPEVDCAPGFACWPTPWRACRRLTGGQAGDFPEALPLLAGRQAEIILAEIILADRGYDSNAIVAAIESIAARAVIPPKVCRKVRRPHDRTLCKLRNRIEGCFNRLKHSRRLATRYCKHRIAFQATVALACMWLHLERYVDTA